MMRSFDGVRRTFAGMVAAAGVGIAACSLADLTGPKATVIQQFGDFTVSVSGGAKPRFSWDGAAASAISVHGSGNFTSYGDWEIFADDRVRGIASPVQYGSVPNGAHCFAREPCPTFAALRTGETYTVSVIRTDGATALAVFQL